MSHSLSLTGSLYLWFMKENVSYMGEGHKLRVVCLLVGLNIYTFGICLVPMESLVLYIN